MSTLNVKSYTNKHQGNRKLFTDVLRALLNGYKIFTFVPGTAIISVPNFGRMVFFLFFFLSKTIYNIPEISIKY